MRKIYLFFIALLFLSNVNAQWVTAGTGAQNFADAYTGNTVIAIDSAGTPYVALDGGAAAVVYLSGNTWQLFGNGYAFPNQVGSMAMVMLNGAPLIGFTETNNNGDPTSAIFQSGSWQALGASPILHEYGFYPQMALDTADSPYMMFIDGGINIIKFNGSSWGAPAIAYRSSAMDDEYGRPDFIVKGTTPYVAFSDPANHFGATVLYYNGSGWDTAGHAGFTDSIAYVSLAKDTNGVLYMSAAPGGPYYSPQQLEEGFNVYRFDGTNWNALPMPFNGRAGVAKLAVSRQTNQLYVMYRDSATAGRLSVKVFDGASWQLVGNADFSGPNVEGQSLAIAPDNTPYVSYKDSTVLHVFKFEGPTAVKDITSAAISVYPNPTVNTLEINCPDAIKHLMVYDINGRLVLDEKDAVTNYISTSNITSGFYQLKVITETGAFTAKFIKQ